MDSANKVKWLVGVLLLLLSVNSQGQQQLRGKITTDGEITIGVSLWIAGTATTTLSDINGEFEFKDLPEGRFRLIVNPCCSCYNNLQILIEKETFEITIDCNCIKSKAMLKKRLRIGESIKEKKAKLSIK